MLLTQLFLITFFAALVGVLPPGLVNMTVAKTCVEKGKRAGVYAGLGASTIVFIQATLAILMAKFIFDHPSVQKNLLRVGLVVFIILAIHFFIAAKKKRTKKKTSEKEVGRSFLKGMMIASLNVFPIPYFVAVSSAINSNDKYIYDKTTIFLFALAACLGTFTTLYIYVVSFMKIETHTQKFSKFSNYFMAALMLVLILVTLFRLFF
ncbi:LysE family translocator [Mesonia sp. K7]|uniref:LysE family translocator n=1 Tax=Mesonia sp. K7 TaxID=2218606 RepID=UPI000DA73592|nr:LysE family transporter [Mesonia sp. K7]PZD77726.1 lysine transporter LysE [Mesonia sp. K7]